MIHQLVAASLLLRFLAVSAAGQRQQKGEFLASMAHVSAISKEELESTVSLMSVKGSKSASTIALQGATLSGKCCVIQVDRIPQKLVIFITDRPNKAI